MFHRSDPGGVAPLLFMLGVTLACAQIPAEDDGQWRTAAKDDANTRYSALDEIRPENVAQLQVAWTFSTGLKRGHEAAPLVVGDTLYMVTPFPNTLYALNVADGAVKWRYDPSPDRAAQGVACCDVVNRGAVFSDGRIFYNTLDVHTVAVDAATGRELWKTKLGDFKIGESMTMAPVVVNGKVIVGNSGAEFGVRGWVLALEAATGKILWRAYSTGPDADCLIGPDFTPHYAQDRGKDLGVTSWPPEAWRIGGGTVWGWVSYDPKLNLIFHGTGNPGPWNADQRPGANKWTCGIFARNPDTGQARWFYQWSPHDLYDYDGINENIVVDLEWEGRMRPVLLHAGRNGFVYVLDRATGQVLSADAFAYITSTTHVDLTTGLPHHVPEKTPVVGRVIRDIAPASPGAKDWQPCAYSPRTRFLYIPHQNLRMDVEAAEANYIAGTPFLGANVRMYAGPGGHRGEFSAWDPVARKEAWTIRESFPVWSGTVVTAGDVAFYGTMDGWFKAVHARTGAPLWQFKCESGIIGQPVTYRAPDGRQYVAVLAGVGGWAGAIVSGQLDPRDGTGALGFVAAMRDLPSQTTTGGKLYVFRLP
jgi:PQQ-dependent dehydrogenase (methanol/ethanol family)